MEKHVWDGKYLVLLHIIPTSFYDKPVLNNRLLWIASQLSIVLVSEI